MDGCIVDELSFFVACSCCLLLAFISSPAKSFVKDKNLMDENPKDTRKPLDPKDTKTFWIQKTSSRQIQNYIFSPIYAILNLFPPFLLLCALDRITFGHRHRQLTLTPSTPNCLRCLSTIASLTTQLLLVVGGS